MLSASPMDMFQTYNWTPLVEISEDENWMDLLLLLTRSSQLKQGSMACILVRKPDTYTEIVSEQSLPVFAARIISIGTNQPLYSDDSSDVHAEIVAIGQAARRASGTSCSYTTEGCAAYITMPPCKNCFAALYAAGVKRIVSRYDIKCHKILDAATKHCMELITVEEQPEQRERINSYVRLYKSWLEERESESDWETNEPSHGTTETWQPSTIL